MRNRAAVVPTQPAFDDSRQGEGGKECRACQEYPSERTALRKPGRGTEAHGPLGNALGRHTHSRHYQTAGGRYVRRRTPRAATVAGRAVPLLPIRPTLGK